MSRRRPQLAALLATLAVVIGSGALAAAARAAEDPALEPPFGGQEPPPLVEPDSQTSPPDGFSLSADDAIDAADATDVVTDQLAETRDARPRALIRGDAWQVGYVTPDGD